MWKIWIGLSMLLMTVGCAQLESEKDKPASLGLKDAFANDFFIGTALNTGQIYQKDSTTDAVIKKHFNAIVAENCMKSESLHPEKDRFFWDEADAFVEYGVKNNMHITGHTLAWHSQTPPWFFIDDEGNDVDREEMIKRLKEHITTIVTRYKGKVHGYDVVNEAINDDGTMRESKFYKIIGADWVELAFQFAAEADPQAELFYNDYNMSRPAKMQAVYDMVSKMQSKGIRVDGVGMQGHVNVNSDDPPISDLENSIVQLSKLGKVMITELDITSLPWPEDLNAAAEISISSEYHDSMNPYPDGLPDTMALKLHNRFMSLFDLFEKHKDKISRVTAWGVNDAQTWRNNWPIKGRSDYPLLFNRDNTPKPVVDSLIIRKSKIEKP